MNILVIGTVALSKQMNVNKIQINKKMTVGSENL